MKIEIVPSPAILARADTPISECVRRMRDHRVGSLLVVNDREHEDLVGIFTERDLLKFIDLIHQGGHWEKPIRTVMTSPVKTISPTELSSAGEIMLQGGFRHLPVATQDAEGRVRVLGVISVRDVLRQATNQVHELEQQLPAPSETPLAKIAARIGVLSRDAEFIQMMKGAFAPVKDLLVRRISSKTTLFAKGAVSGLYRLNILIFDLDRWSGAKWAEFLRLINADPQAPYTVVIFDPLLHPAGTAEVLSRLGASNRFAVYARPIDLFAFFEALKEKTAGFRSLAKRSPRKTV